MNEKLVENISVAEEMAYIEAPFRNLAIKAIEQASLASEAYYSEITKSSEQQDDFDEIAHEPIKDETIYVSKADIQQYAKDNNFGSNNQAWRSFAHFEATRIAHLGVLPRELTEDIEQSRLALTYYGDNPDERTLSEDGEVYTNVVKMYLGKDYFTKKYPAHYKVDISNLQNFIEHVHQQVDTKQSRYAFSKLGLTAKNLSLLDGLVEFKLNDQSNT